MSGIVRAAQAALGSAPRHRGPGSTAEGVLARTVRLRGAVIAVAAVLLPGLACAGSSCVAGVRSGPAGEVPSGATCVVVSVSVASPDFVPSVEAPPASPCSEPDREQDFMEGIGWRESSLQRCYNDALATNPGLAGVAAFRVLLPEVNVVRVEVVSTTEALFRAGVVECIQRVLSGLPAASCETGLLPFGVRLPFTFLPPDDASQESGTGTPADPESLPLLQEEVPAVVREVPPPPSPPTVPPAPQPLPQEAAAVVARGGHDALLACYGAASAATQGYEVMPVVLALNVGADGEPTEVAASSTLPLDPGFSRCLTATGRAWRFPTSCCESQVDIEFWFRPP